MFAEAYTDESRYLLRATDFNIVFHHSSSDQMQAYTNYEKIVKVLLFIII